MSSFCLTGGRVRPGTVPGLRRAGRLALCAVAAASVVACSGQDVAKRLANVRQQIDAGDYATAVVGLKEVLQKDANVGEARLLLGRLHLQSGDALSAEAELRRALEAGVPLEQVAPWLARALLDAAKPKKVVEELVKVEPTDVGAWADLRTSVAEAYARTGNMAQARSTVADVLARKPGYSKALLVQARLLSGGADGLQASLKQVAEVLAAEPRNVDAQRLQSDLLMYAKRDLPAAIASYQKLVELAPNRLDSHVSLAFALLRHGDLDAAARQVETMTKLSPQNPQTRYVAAQVAYARKEYVQVRDISQELLKLAPNNVELLELSGAAEVQLRAWQRAETLLGKAVYLAPNRLVARQLLARALVHSGRSEKALETLRPVLDGGRPDADTLMVAAEAHLFNGKPALAAPLFAKALAQRPDDDRIRSAMALTDVSRGQAAMASLSDIAATSKSTTADLALISLLMQRADYAKASAAIAQYDKKEPRNPQPAFLQAQARAGLGDDAGMKRGFEEAQARDPKYFPAVAGLVQWELRQNQRDAAWARLEAFLKTEPTSEPAWLALAGLAMQMPDGRARQRAVLQRGLAAVPRSVDLAVLSVDQQLRARENKAALAAAQALRTAHPGRADVAELLGRTQMANGDVRQAQKSYSDMASLAPRSPAPHLRQMEALRVAGDLPSAMRAARRALELAPDNGMAMSALVALAAQSRQPEQALQAIRDIKQRFPDAGLAFVLEGDLLGSQGKWDEALAAYRAGSAKANPGVAPVRLHATLTQLKREPEAAAFAQDWMRRHPKDAGFIGHLGEVALHAKDYQAAERRFREAVALEPADASAYNNIAWAMLKQGKPGALEFARKANLMSPAHTEFADTLASALAASGDLKQAVAVQGQLVADLPNAPRYRLALAKLLLQAGDKRRAREELDTLAKLGATFDQQDVVRSLSTQAAQ
ncbi:MAG: XrtA/PEP-CTERM system TPR-repeat protein PrsT [Pseudomonadota bacterium]